MEWIFWVALLKENTPPNLSFIPLYLDTLDTKAKHQQTTKHNSLDWIIKHAVWSHTRTKVLASAKEPQKIRVIQSHDAGLVAFME